MSIITATKNGEKVTLVQPDKDTKETINELKRKGYKNIKDEETGEQFN